MNAISEFSRLRRSLPSMGVKSLYRAIGYDRMPFRFRDRACPSTILRRILTARLRRRARPNSISPRTLPARLDNRAFLKRTTSRFSAALAPTTGWRSLDLAARPRRVLRRVRRQPRAGVGARRAQARYARGHRDAGDDAGGEDRRRNAHTAAMRSRWCWRAIGSSRCGRTRRRARIDPDPSVRRCRRSPARAPSRWRSCASTTGADPRDSGRSAAAA